MIKKLAYSNAEARRVEQVFKSMLNILTRRINVGIFKNLLTIFDHLYICKLTLMCSKLSVFSGTVKYINLLTYM